MVEECSIATAETTMQLWSLVVFYYERGNAVAKQREAMAALEVAFWLWCVFFGRRRA